MFEYIFNLIINSYKMLVVILAFQVLIRKEKGINQIQYKEFKKSCGL